MEDQATAPQGREEEENNPNNRTDLINTFSDITSASKEEAIFFLESHNFDLDSAVSTFFETNSALPVDADDLPAPANTSPTYSPSRSRSRSPSPSPPVVFQPNPYSLRSRQGSAPSGNKTDKKPSGSRPGGIRTLSDLNRRAIESGSDSDEPQEYYTGGEKSGMMVQDPTKVNDVDSLFNQARQAGAVEGSADQLLPSSSSSSRSFRGTARLLSGETLSSAPQPPEVITHHITFWSNGFTVDDGPLRMLDDPQNAPFLESIRKSECPKELEPADRKTSVHVSLTRREENCPVQQKQQVSFQGVGRTLGGTPAEPSVAVAAPPSTVPAPTMGLVVDNALPSTSIQLRLADGTRMVSRFNHNHTIRDIRGFIDASRPGGPRAYHLQTVGFPPKQLTDLDQTIDQAGLANSVVIQKL